MKTEHVSGRHHAAFLQIAQIRSYLLKGSYLGVSCGILVHSAYRKFKSRYPTITPALSIYAAMQMPPCSLICVRLLYPPSLALGEIMWGSVLLGTGVGL